MTDSFALSLRLAPKDQYTALYAIMALAGDHMHRVLGLSHWHPFFSSDRFIERLGERDAYGVYADDILVGTFSLGPQPEPYYLDDMSEYWQVATEEADYFSTFALLPSYQQHGIGTWCMQQADTIAREAGYRWLRFDAVASHPKLLHFYSRLGYEQRGILDLGRAQVMCYEKDLSQAGS